MTPKKLRKPGPFKVGHSYYAEIVSTGFKSWRIDFYGSIHQDEWPRFVKWLTRANAWIEQEERKK